MSADPTANDPGGSSVAPAPGREAAAGPVPCADDWTDSDAAGGPRSQAETLLVDVEGFEGPLDLLLALARTQKVDIARISMVALVDQFLGFIRDARKLRLELAADYLVMAAWLAFLKSRLLLPKEEDDSEQPSGEELAARLSFRLMRLDAMRQAAAQLMARNRLGRDVFARGMPEGVKTIREREYTAQIFDLLKAYATQRTRTIQHKPHVVKARTVWSIKQARQQLEKLVGSSGQWVQLDMFLHLYLHEPELSKTVRASSLGASLEMARDGQVELRQEKPFAPIFMRRLVAGAAWEVVE